MSLKNFNKTTHGCPAPLLQEDVNAHRRHSTSQATGTPSRTCDLLNSRSENEINAVKKMSVRDMVKRYDAVAQTAAAQTPTTSPKAIATPPRTSPKSPKTIATPPRTSPKSPTTPTTPTKTMSPTTSPKTIATPPPTNPISPTTTTTPPLATTTTPPLATTTTPPLATTTTPPLATTTTSPLVTTTTPPLATTTTQPLANTTTDVQIDNGETHILPNVTALNKTETTPRNVSAINETETTPYNFPTKFCETDSMYSTGSELSAFSIANVKDSNDLNNRNLNCNTHYKINHFTNNKPNVMQTSNLNLTASTINNGSATTIDNSNAEISTTKQRIPPPQVPPRRYSTNAKVCTVRCNVHKNNSNHEDTSVNDMDISNVDMINVHQITSDSSTIIEKIQYCNPNNMNVSSNVLPGNAFVSTTDPKILITSSPCSSNIDVNGSDSKNLNTTWNHQVNGTIPKDRELNSTCEQTQTETSYHSRTTIAKTTNGVRIIIDIFLENEQPLTSDMFGNRIETIIPHSRILSEFQEHAGNLCPKQSNESTNTSASDSQC